jgi:hypothetical protein
LMSYCFLDITLGFFFALKEEQKQMTESWWIYDMLHLRILSTDFRKLITVPLFTF